MKQVDYLIKAIGEKIRYHASVGVGSRIQVLVASQNEEAVRKGIGEIAHNVLNGSEWDNRELSQTELTLRTAILLKNLFYSKRIVVEIKVKAWPETMGDHFQFDVSSFDCLFYDKDTCEGYLRYLERQ